MPLNPFEKATRGVARRAEVREQGGHPIDAREQKKISDVKRCIEELKTTPPDYQYVKTKQLIDLINNIRPAGFYDFLEELTGEEFSVLAENVIASGDGLYGLPREIWMDYRGKQAVLAKSKEYLESGKYVNDSENDYSYLAAKDLLDIGAISIGEVHTEAIRCLRKNIQYGNVVQTEQLVKDIRAAGKEIRIGKSDVLNGYQEILSRIANESAEGLIYYIDNLAKLKNLTNVPIEGSNLQESIAGAQLACLVQDAVGGSEYSETARLSELIGKKPDWSGVLREKVTHLVWDFIGTGRSRSYNTYVDCGVAARIMKMTGVKVEFDEYQRKQIQLALRKKMGDESIPLNDVFDISHEIGVRIDSTDPDVSEDILGMYRGAISGNRAFSFKTDFGERTRLQTMDRLYERDFLDDDTRKSFEILHSLRDLRHECGSAMFHKAMEDAHIRKFLSRMIVSDHNNDLAVEELYGLPFTEWLKKEKNKELFAALIFERVGFLLMEGRLFFNWEDGQPVNEEVEKCLSLLQNKNGNGVEMRLTGLKLAFFNALSKDQSVSLKILATESTNLYRSFPDACEKAISNSASSILSNYDVSRAQGLYEIVSILPPEKKKEIEKKMESQIARMFVGYATGERNFDGLKLMTGGLTPNSVQVEKVHLEYVSRNPSTSLFDLNGLKGARELLNFTGSATHREAIKNKIKENVLELLVTDPPELMQGWLQLTGLKLQRAETAEVFMKSIEGAIGRGATIRQLAIMFEAGMPTGAERKKALEIIERDKTVRYIPELLAFVGPRTRKEYCPYTEKIPKILEIAKSGGFNEAGIPGAIRYMKEYGFLPIPELVRTFAQLEAYKIQLMKNPQSTDILHPSMRTRLEEFLQVHSGATLPEKITVKDIESIFMAFSEAKNQLKKSLLEDKVPESFDRSPIHMELFNAMVPASGNYGSYTDRKQRITTWRLTCLRAEQESQPNRVRLPNGYEKEVFPIKKYSFDQGQSFSSILGSGDSQEQLALEDKRIRGIKEQIKVEQEKKSFTEYLGIFTDGLDAEDMSLWEKERFGIFFDGLEMKERETIERAKKMLETEGEMHPKKKMGLVASIQKAEAQLQKIEQARTHFSQEFDKARGQLSGPEIILETMVHVFGTDVGVMAKKEIGICVMAIARQKAPVHISQIREAMTQAGGAVMTDRLRTAWEKWFYEELVEHLGNPAETKLSKEAHTVLSKFFQIHLIRDRLQQAAPKPVEGKGMIHPFHDTMTKIRRLEAGISGKSVAEDSVPIGYYPVHGLGRVFAADLANACFNKLSGQLAQNEFPRINADLLVQEDEKRLDILGSTLWIEAETHAGKKVLLIRALNPREDVVQRELSADGIVMSTIERAIGIAKKRGLDEVRMCHDHSGGHATNRAMIFSAEAKLIRERGYMRAKQDLVSTPETNFNGYRVWGAYETFVVWNAAQQSEVAK